MNVFTSIRVASMIATFIKSNRRREAGTDWDGRA